MTEHLPECPCVHHPSEDLWCICWRLRACEERVAKETETAMMNFFYWKPSPPHDKHYFADSICAYCVGHREALDAAAQRVAALPEYALRHTCVSAIDELRKEEK
jgi:hypothetical protein